MGKLKLNSIYLILHILCFLTHYAPTAKMFFVFFFSFIINAIPTTDFKKFAGNFSGTRQRTFNMLHARKSVFYFITFESI